jgi:hypothetical protein
VVGAPDFHTELDRVVDRLRTMPLSRTATAAELTYPMSCRILQLQGTSQKDLPRIADRAAGDQLAVIGRDFIATTHDEAAIAEATAALVELRRALP